LDNLKEGGERMADQRVHEIKILVPEELFSLFIPAQAHEHALLAKKEVLLVMRSLLDARIEALEKRTAPKSTPKKKINID
jgi:hypothetical protein